MVNDYEIDGKRWGITFLVTDMRLTQEEREELMRESTLLYLSDEKTKNIQGERYEGRLTLGKYEYIASGFGGRRVDVDLDIDGASKSSSLTLLVQEKIRASLN